ncbi:uncharacterized protein LOC122365837 [Amphibalanus amphitrite]|uniref:uncharacterized protein LOC122365837 n=1 Tax=Amphibalanus amphitrite TaxID=1232801 RepID=UPI001C921397|nr:uncharacterized protein LOC122365837 [Amphibalanus amphitrite]
MGFVNKIISRLDSEDKYGPMMKELGCRHVSYGAKPQYVDMMGEQFISVIRPSLIEANQWNEGTEAAWRKLFQVIGYSMKMGLQEHQRTPTPRLRPNTPSPRPGARQYTPDENGTSDVMRATSDVTRVA